MLAMLLVMLAISGATVTCCHCGRSPGLEPSPSVSPPRRRLGAGAFSQIHAALDEFQGTQGVLQSLATAPRKAPTAATRPTRWWPCRVCPTWKGWRRRSDASQPPSRRLSAWTPGSARPCRPPTVVGLGGPLSARRTDNWEVQAVSFQESLN